jgi:hypothetical protein
MALPTIAPAATLAVTVLIRALRPSLCNRGTAMVPLYRSADFRHLLQAPTSVVVRRDAAIDRTEDLDVQRSESAASSAGPVPNAGLSQQTAHISESRKADHGSKQSRVIAMLQSPTGATIAAMMKATGWHQHSVRGFLAGVVRKRLKMKLSSKKVDGNRVYQIASGESGKSTSRQSKRRSV